MTGELYIPHLILLSIFFLIFFNTAFAQFDYLEINLEVRPTISLSKNQILIKLFKKDSTFLLKIESNPRSSEKKYLKTKKDTTYIISKNKFNEIAELAINLSSSKILHGMTPYNPMIFNDGMGIDLEIKVFQSKIKYSIICPNNQIKERNLEPFIYVCNKIILLAKLSPKDIF